MTLKTPGCNVVAKLILATSEKNYAWRHARLVKTKDLPPLNSTGHSKYFTAEFGQNKGYFKSNQQKSCFSVTILRFGEKDGGFRKPNME
jgi:hypothetical protein